VSSENPFSVAFAELKSLLAAIKTINMANYVLLFPEEQQ
jgi:hypothetical protein